MSTRGVLGFLSKGNLKVMKINFDASPGGVGFDVVNFVSLLNKKDEKRYRKLASEIKNVEGDIAAFEDRTISGILTDGVLIDGYSFAGNSLFCEWGYIINFDRRVIEFYAGFNQQVLDSRARFNELAKVNSYQPIRHILDIDFDFAKKVYVIGTGNIYKTEEDPIQGIHVYRQKDNTELFRVIAR
jgi:hypothetical protein